MFREGAMRRWRLLSRLLRRISLTGQDRFVLVVEELEGREVPAPLVIAPAFDPFLRPPEGSNVFFAGNPQSGGTSFFASDSDDVEQSYTATLSASNGTVTVDDTVASDYGVVVTDNGT